MTLNEMTEAELEDLDGIVVEMRKSDREALENDPDFGKWLELVAARTD